MAPALRLARSVAADFLLPAIAEYQDHHLLLDIRVMAESLDRAATLHRQLLVRELCLPRELRKRRDLFRKLAVLLHPEFALEAHVLLFDHIDDAQRAAVAFEVVEHR